MKHRITTLDGPLLDAAVAKAEGLTLHGRWWRRPDAPDVDWCEQAYFDPSRRWKVGGPIIERERLELRNDTSGGWNCMGNGCYGEGPTPLIAAMRAFVASKYGTEIDLP